MTGKPKQPDPREVAKEAVVKAAKEQMRLWDFLNIEIHAATQEVNGREHQLIWAKIEELANADSYPLWMDAVLTTLMIAVPVTAMVGTVGKMLTRSKKMLALPGLPPVRTYGPVRPPPPDRIYLKPHDQLKALMGRPVGPLTMNEAVDRSKTWFHVGRTLEPEITNALQDLIKQGAQALVKPRYEKDVVTPGKKARVPDGTGLPSVAVFKAMLQWVVLSRNADEEILKQLAERVDTSTDSTWLKSVPEYLEIEDLGLSASQSAVDTGPPEAFQRFVEACLWCTTYDFTPEFATAKLEHPTSKWDKPKYTPPRAILFPFPEAFWVNLTKRHYDPFVKGGTKTYEELGHSGYVAPEGQYVPPSMTAATFLETGMEFDPRTRLSMHWSGILAPAVLSANKEMTTVLDTFSAHP